jgi:hypothetical protein
MVNPSAWSVSAKMRLRNNKPNLTTGEPARGCQERHELAVEVLERMGSVEVLVRGPPLLERVADLQKSGVG